MASTVMIAMTVWIARTVTTAMYDGFDSHDSFNNHDGHDGHDRASTFLVKVLIPTKRGLLPRVCDVQPDYADIQMFIEFVNFYQRFRQWFNKIAALLTLMLRTSSSTDSSTSAAQIVVEYHGVDDGGGGDKLVKKSSKVKKPQRPGKAIGLEEPSFLTSNTRLAVTKMGPSRNSV